MRMWCLLSQKMLGTDRSKTIAAVQSAKSLMDKVQYPKNTVYRQIQRLEEEARSLNKRIGHFLEKHRPNDM